MSVNLDIATMTDAYDQGKLDNEEFLVLWRRMEKQFQRKTFATSLGDAVVLEAKCYITHERPPLYQFEMAVEFPRLDHLFRLTSKTPEMDYVVRKLAKSARTWATKEANRILRVEDEQSGVREIRRLEKSRGQTNLAAFFEME